MLKNKIRQWWNRRQIENRNKEIHKIAQTILSILVNKENDLTHVEQSEILNNVIQQFKDRKKLECIKCSNTISELESAISKLC